jgi:hypothetical protein
MELASADEAGRQAIRAPTIQAAERGLPGVVSPVAAALLVLEMLVLSAGHSPATC